MKCRNCKREIEDKSRYCNWCGFKQDKEKNDIAVPKPTKTKNGYTAQIMVKGERVRVTEPTEAKYYERAREIKSGKQAVKPLPTLKEAITDYINSNSETLSPATLRGYDQILRLRFNNYMLLKLDSIDYQKMVNDEAKKDISPKSIKNAWGLVTAAAGYAGFHIPAINLPKVPKAETDFLDHKQVKTFIAAVKGDDCEIAALLALHSLRASEMYHLQASDIKDNTIRVHGATVRDKNNKWVDKDTNKNRTSTRDIPIIIPRLKELLPASGPVITIKQTTVREHIENICKAHKLPVCSLHDLRRSFASLAAYLGWKMETICAVGGWRPGSPVVHDIYIKVSNTAIKEDVKKMKKFLAK